jgi:uncharacterized protein (TIGR02145 family)
MTQNLRDTIGLGKDQWSTAVDALTKDSKVYAYPGGNYANVATYGVLYTYAALVKATLPVTENSAISAQGMCPAGWHVPYANEWIGLFKSIALDTDTAYSLTPGVNWPIIEGNYDYPAMASKMRYESWWNVTAPSDSKSPVGPDPARRGMGLKGTGNGATLGITGIRAYYGATKTTVGGEICFLNVDVWDDSPRFEWRSAAWGLYPARCKKN